MAYTSQGFGAKPGNGIKPQDSRATEGGRDAGRGRAIGFDQKETSGNCAIVSRYSADSPEGIATEIRRRSNEAGRCQIAEQLYRQMMVESFGGCPIGWKGYS